MGKLKGTLVLMVAVLASTAWGQELMPKTEFTAGYTYASLDQNIGFGSAGRLNANGWNTGATAYINRWLGVEGNIAGVSHSESASFVSGVTTVSGSAEEKHYTFVFGPRIALGRSRMTPFVHALFGVDRETLSASSSSPLLSVNVSATDSAFATALGGGLNYAVTKHVGFTTGADYLLTRHGLPSQIATLTGLSGSASQNDFRVSAGLVFRFGFGGQGQKR